MADSWESILINSLPHVKQVIFPALPKTELVVRNGIATDNCKMDEEEPPCVALGGKPNQDGNEDSVEDDGAPPDETPEARRKRKNRERQKRHREKKRKNQQENQEKKDAALKTDMEDTSCDVSDFFIKRVVGPRYFQIENRKKKYKACVKQVTRRLCIDQLLKKLHVDEKKKRQKDGEHKQTTGGT